MGRPRVALFAWFPILVKATLYYGSFCDWNTVNENLDWLLSLKCTSGPENTRPSTFLEYSARICSFWSLPAMSSSGEGEIVIGCYATEFCYRWFHCSGGMTLMMKRRKRLLPLFWRRSISDRWLSTSDKGWAYCSWCHPVEFKSSKFLYSFGLLALLSLIIRVTVGACFHMGAVERVAMTFADVDPSVKGTNRQSVAQSCCINLECKWHGRWSTE